MLTKINTIQFFALGKCKFSCAACSLFNNKRDTVLAFTNLRKALIAGKKYLANHEYVYLELESAGILTSAQEFVENGYFAKLLQLIKFFNIHTIESLDYFSSLDSCEYLEDVTKLITTENIKLLLSCPDLEEEVTEFVPVANNIFYRAARLLTPDTIKISNLRLPRPFNYYGADKYQSAEDLLEYRKLFEQYLCENKIDLSLSDLVLLVDDNPHNIVYLSTEILAQAKFLYAVPVRLDHFSYDYEKALVYLRWTHERIVSMY